MTAYSVMMDLCLGQGCVRWCVHLPTTILPIQPSVLVSRCVSVTIGIKYVFIACPQNCINCSGLNQCDVCSDNYTMLNTSSRQVCVLQCSNGSFYNQSTGLCEGMCV